MITVAGYKAFHGTMRITWVTGKVEEITADWLYKPEFRCWYGAGRSFDEEACTVLIDEDEWNIITPDTKEEDLPPIGVPVLVCRKKDSLITEQATREICGWWRVYGTRVKRIIGWKPMPKPAGGEF